ncbi:MAG: ABC transporter substrate-binding protein [Chitinophagales bacterium]
MIRITLGGVPEHFNLPLELALEAGWFTEVGLDVQWTYYPGGTGAMTRALGEGALDMAILLTEGFVAAAAQGLPAVLVKTWVESPLVWGIYSGAHSATHSIYDRTPKQYAISRHGSGSHLMALIHAAQRGEVPAPEQFTVVNSIECAVASLTAGQTQVFYWEQLMTQQYVAGKQLKNIGSFQAPWSGFLVAAGTAAWQQKRTALQQVLAVMNRAAQTFPAQPHFQQQLQQRFGLAPADTAPWLQHTVWNTGYDVKTGGLYRAAAELKKLLPDGNYEAVEQWLG